jgi:hypothetical protein
VNGTTAGCTSCASSAGAASGSSAAGNTCQCSGSRRSPALSSRLALTGANTPVKPAVAAEVEGVLVATAAVGHVGDAAGQVVLVEVCRPAGLVRRARRPRGDVKWREPESVITSR